MPADDATVPADAPKPNAPSSEPGDLGQSSTIHPDRATAPSPEAVKRERAFEAEQLADVGRSNERVVGEIAEVQRSLLRRHAAARGGVNFRPGRGRASPV